MTLNTRFPWDQEQAQHKFRSFYRHPLAGHASFSLCSPRSSWALLSEEPLSCPLCGEDPQLSGNLPAPPTCRARFQLRQVPLSLAQIFPVDSPAFPHPTHPTPPQTLFPSPADSGDKGAPWGLASTLPAWCGLPSCCFPFCPLGRRKPPEMEWPSDLKQRHGVSPQL